MVFGIKGIKWSPYVDNGYVEARDARKRQEKAAKLKKKGTPAPVAPTKGILRRPSTHFTTYEERREDLPTDNLPSTDSGPYPKAMARHSELRASDYPPNWQPGMALPDIKGAVNYVTVNNVPTPNRYCREPSVTPFPHPGLRCVMRTLQITLKRNHKRFTDHLDTEGVLSGEYWDAEQDGVAYCPRKTENKFLVLQAERDWEKVQRDYHVFGGNIKVICEKASKPISVHGYQFKVPIILEHCVEEIYRRGMNVPDLFMTPPNRRRIKELIVAYDGLTDVGPFPDLRRESIYDVANLLGFWLTVMPTPFMHRTFFDGFSAWCCEPSLTREEEFRNKVQVRNRKDEAGEYHSETDTEAEAELAEDEACPGLPSFNSRQKRMRKKQRAIEREKRHAFAAAHPDLVVSNRPTHQQRRAQMYKELLHIEKPQVNHARLMLMLLAPHSFATMLYLFTFLASLLDHPSNNLTAKIFADKFAWKLLGGPNKEVSRELMEWFLTRWDRITRGLKSEEAAAWEKKREEAGKAGPPSPPSSEKDEPAPQYQSDRRRSDASDAPSYHSTWSGPYAKDRKTSGSSSTRSPADSRRSSVSSEASSSASRPRPTKLAAAPRVHDFNPGPPICGPQPSPAAVELTNPWDTEDTPVIEPFNDDTVNYEAEDGEFDDEEDEDDEWDRPQHNEFAAIEGLLRHKSGGRDSVSTPSVHSVDSASVYSQDDDDVHEEFIDDIINNYSNDAQRKLPSLKEESEEEDGCLIPPVKAEPHRSAEDDATRLKKEFEEALIAREMAQKKMEELSKKMSGIQMR